MCNQGNGTHSKKRRYEMTEDHEVQLVNLGELMASKSNEEWAEEMKTKCGWIHDAETKTFDFVEPPYSTGNPYYIDEDRCDTPEKALGLISHLGGKTWMDAFRCQCLINMIAHHFGWKIHGW